jgi:hypothetical protein
LSRGVILLPIYVYSFFTNLIEQSFFPSNMVSLASTQPQPIPSLPERRRWFLLTAGDPPPPSPPTSTLDSSHTPPPHPRACIQRCRRIRCLCLTPGSRRSYESGFSCTAPHRDPAAPSSNVTGSFHRPGRPTVCHLLLPSLTGPSHHRHASPRVAALLG